MTKEREGEILMVGLAILESWFPIFSIVSISYIGDKFKELKNKEAYKDLLLTSFWITSLFALVFIGMRYTTAGNMAVIIFLQLLFSYLYFNVFGKEKMHSLHVWGAFIMGIGALIILIPAELTFNKGDLLILVAAAIAPLANLYQKRAREFCSSETILGFRTLVGLPFIALMAWAFEPAVRYDAFVSALPSLLFIGILIYVVSKIMWIEALHRTSITKLSAMMGLVPMMTLIFAYFYLNEVPELRQVLGIIPVLAGGYLLTKPLTEE